MTLSATNEHDNDEVDIDLAMVNMGQSTPPTVQPPPPGPEQHVWREVVDMVRQTIPLSRACAIQGLDPRRVRRWLLSNPDARAELEASKAAATAQLVSVVWKEATAGDGNWKAALSLLRHTDAAFDPGARKAKKTESGTTVRITAQTAQVLATADVEHLKQLVGS